MMEKCPSNDPDDISRWCLRDARGAMTDEQYQAAVHRIRDAIQNGFDGGFRAAGGSIHKIIRTDTH